MNRIILVINAVLLLAVGYLFYKVLGTQNSEKNEESNKEETKAEIKKPEDIIRKNVPATGKIAFVDIGKLDDKSLFIDAMVSKMQAKQRNIEASLENLGMQYEAKVKEYQASQSAGIMPESELAAKGKEIQRIEIEAQNKRIQMDNLAKEMNELNLQFKNDVKRIIMEQYADKYDFILSYSETLPVLLYGNESFDITDEVIELINNDFKARKATSKK